MSQRFAVIALAKLLCDQPRLHIRAGVVQMHRLADLMFGAEPVRAAIDETIDVLTAWGAHRDAQTGTIGNAVLDVILTTGSPSLREVTYDHLVQLAAEYPPGMSGRQGIFKLSRVLAHLNVIPAGPDQQPPPAEQPPVNPGQRPRRMAELGTALAGTGHARTRHRPGHVLDHPGRRPVGR